MSLLMWFNEKYSYVRLAKMPNNLGRL